MKIKKKISLCSTQFALRKMGEDAISHVFREKLEQDMNGYQTTMSQTLDSFNRAMHHYDQRMLESLNGVQYFPLNDFVNVQQNIRNEATSQVCQLIFPLQKKKVSMKNPKFE